MNNSRDNCSKLFFFVALIFLTFFENSLHFSITEIRSCFPIRLGENKSNAVRHKAEELLSNQASACLISPFLAFVGSCRSKTKHKLKENTQSIKRVKKERLKKGQSGTWLRFLDEDIFLNRMGCRLISIQTLVVHTTVYRENRLFCISLRSSLSIFLLSP